MESNTSFHKRRILSFKYALEGIFEAVKEEPNLKFHFIFGYLVILAGIIVQLTKLEWMLTVILIGLVISVELTNTAIEAVVDSFTTRDHPAAKLAKDISAGATLVVAVTSAVVGLMIFMPHLQKLWTLFYP